ncbi:AAA family ATPase [Agaribacterium haliotis]|uniref:AAA family ATPase n=1 Tax=Agaribacterium haliotis TaxID=2013869 RepID=UPI000BB5926E|nr:MoxR family ATPase [Agaribacterium haliotis]
MLSELQTIVKAVGQLLLGKEEQIKLALCCLLARGHLLIEDLPGMGKTTLAQSLAKVLGLSYQRVQFTSDLLPGDIIGGSIFDQGKGSFRFHPGPVFTQVLLADEINRSTPKAQSALLEAMEERQVSVDSISHALPEPFFVIATQNPLSQAGTYALPESQLDRFLMCLSLGYPPAEAEKALLMGRDPRERLPELKALVDLHKLKHIQAQVEAVKASEALITYIQRLVQFTREHESFYCGLSPRAAMALLRSAKAWALLHGRDHVLPDDVQAVVPAVVEHRVQGQFGNASSAEGQQNLSRLLLNSVAVMAP